MSRRDDAYGHLIHDYHRGTEAQEIVEREDGLINASSGPAAYFAEYRDWPKHQQDAVDLARGRVLDIGCGAGRHALYLQKKGLEVVGIDLSPLAIRTCRERGLRDARVLSITQVDSRLGSFDTILMMGSNFGLFGSMKRARWLLRRFRSITSDNALVVAESADVHATDRPHHLAYHRANRRRGRMPGQLRLRVRYQTYIGAWFDYLKVSRAEMRQVVAGTGWQVERSIPEQGTVYVGVLGKK